MSEPYLGEIRMFGGAYAPVGWMLCAGQTLAISEYEPLYTLIGTTYGGDGVNTFSLPDLRARFPLHQGVRPGVGSYAPGQTLGVEQVTLLSSQLPTHAHTPRAGGTATTASAAGAYPAAWADVPYAAAGAQNTTLASQLASAGAGLPHENRQPYLTVTFIICTDSGIYPSHD